MLYAIGNLLEAAVFAGLPAVECRGSHIRSIRRPSSETYSCSLVTVTTLEQRRDQFRHDRRQHGYHERHHHDASRRVQYRASHD